MNQDEMFKIIGTIMVGFFIIYIVVKMFHLQTTVVEGLTNADGTTATLTTTSGPITSGEAGSSASYATAIKSLTVKLQDELLISKYRKEYESVIINMDDYIGYLMIQQVLNIKTDADIKTKIDSINTLNILKNSKESLNATMAFLDKQ